MTFAKTTCLYIQTTRHTLSVLDMCAKWRTDYQHMAPIVLFCTKNVLFCFVLFCFVLVRTIVNTKGNANRIFLFQKSTSEMHKLQLDKCLVVSLNVRGLLDYG